MHLTNYSINKAFINTKKSDSALLHAKSTSTTVKWKISEFWAYLQKQGHDADLLRVLLFSPIFTLHYKGVLVINRRNCY